MLDLIDSFKLLKGIPLAKYKVVNSESGLNLQFPFWMKASIPGHKTEKKAVLKCNNPKQAKSSLQILKRQFPNNKIIIQEQAEGIEMILGIKEDRVFGKLLLLGFGGTNAEILKDISFRALPAGRKEIEKMLKELRLYPTLITRKKYALGKLIDLTEKISKLKIKEADFNPVILNEKEALIVDSRIEA